MACAGSHAAAAGRAAWPIAALVGLCAAGLAHSVPSSAMPSTVSIELRPVAQVHQASVRLGDIAFLTTRDLATLRQLMALPIGAAPRPGAPASLDRDTIARWVEARSAFGPNAIQWAGAHEVEIQSASQQLSSERIVAAAQSTLVSWLAQRSFRADVEAISTPRDVVLPAGMPTLRVRPLAAHGEPAKRMLVWVDAWVDDRFVRTTAVSFEVAAWAPMAVAAVDVEREVTLDPIVSNGALQQRMVELTMVRHGAPVPADADGQSGLASGTQRLRRPLREGEVLTSAHLEPAPAVARGGWANLQAGGGNVSIQSRVEVLQDARVGQVVRIRVPGSSGEVLARVTGPGQVEVQP